MRAILTRVNSASVTIDGEVVGAIGKGFLILMGVGPNDTEKECRYLAEKALGLRIFEDENGKMNLGLEAVGGEVLVVRPPGPSWAMPCMKNSCPSAKNWAIPLSTAGLALT